VKRAVRLVIIVALMAVVFPSLAHAQRAGMNRSGAGVSVHRRLPVAQKSVFPQPVDPWKFWGPPSRDHFFVNHRGDFAPFVGGSGYIGSSSVIMTAPPPVIVDISPVFYAPSPAWVSGAEIALTAPASLPTQTLVDHGTGWYQLRGDGMTTPYTWVWIPKAPAAPSPPTEPARLAESNVRDHRAEAYQWTDERGVTTWTNRLEKVPRRFRDQAAATAQSD